MFRKEAEEYAEDMAMYYESNHGSIPSQLEKYLRNAVEYGYNKANEWHYVKDGDLPEVDNRIVLCVYGNGYIDGKRNYALKLLTRKEFPLFQPVYAWKEIVLPKECV